MKIGLLLQSLALVTCVVLMVAGVYACSCGNPNSPCGPVTTGVPCCGCGVVSSQCTYCESPEKTCTSEKGSASGNGGKGKATCS